MYTVKDDKDNNNDDFTDTVIKKGSKIKMEFHCKEAGNILKYVRRQTVLIEMHNPFTLIN